MKLGRKPGVVHDRRTITLRSIRKRAQILTPPASSRVGRSEPIRMYANDLYGCCVFASKGHAIDVRERSSRQDDLQLSDDDILQAYAAVTGFRRDQPWTDNGAYMLDGLNHERTAGIGKQKDGTPHRIGAFAALKIPIVPAEFAAASWAFGGVQVGAGLPLTARDQHRDNRTWDVDDTDPGRSAPGSWGGHAMHAVGYTRTGPILATWAGTQKATWAWAARYVDEAYATVSPDLIRTGGTTPQGFDIDRLTAQLSDVGVDILSDLP